MGASDPSPCPSSHSRLEPIGAPRYVLCMSDVVLPELVADAWRLHEKWAGQWWLVSLSAPVLFFGDFSAYRASPLRVATVGLNPSRREFPKGAPFSRFPGAKATNISAYLNSLESYFWAMPLSWFNSYEQALVGLGASYRGQRISSALHTDIGSVLPTDPTWSRLPPHVRRNLSSTGIPLWNRLIGYLEPNIVLWSTGRRWLDYLDLPDVTSWQDILEFRETIRGATRRRPIVVCSRWYRLPNGAPVLIAFIPAAQTPLGRLSHSQKEEAGKVILSNWERGVLGGP